MYVTHIIDANIYVKNLLDPITAPVHTPPSNSVILLRLYVLAPWVCQVELTLVMLQIQLYIKAKELSVFL